MKENKRKNCIYLDHAASTPVSGTVLEAMLPFLTDFQTNPHGSCYSARYALDAVKKARKQVAELIGSEPSGVFFTSGGTESDNLAVLGIARKAFENREKKAGKRLDKKDFRIVTSAIEHPAVLNAAKQLENEGFDVVYADVDSEGLINENDFEKLLTKKTLLVSIMTANNETGTIEPVGRLSALAREAGALFHTDAVQAAGSIPFSVKETGADAVSLSAHKLNGPKGVGALYLKNPAIVEPLMFGGGQEKGIRPGTLNVPGIVGFGKACEEAAERLENGGASRLAGLRDRFLDGVLEAVPEAHLNGSKDKRLPGNINISFPGCDSSTLLVMLDAAGICASGGSACSSISGRKSHVLAALGLDDKVINGALRLTLGHETTEEETKKCIGELARIADNYRKMGILRAL
jgi:cysteine desulfurase